MKKISLCIAISFISVYMIGCAAWTQSYMDTIATDDKITAKAVEVSVERAAFDIGCDNVVGKALGDIVQQKVYKDGVTKGYAELNIGIIGCDKRVSYLVACTFSDKATSISCSPRLNSVAE